LDGPSSPAMDHTFEIIRTTRNNFLKLIEGLTGEQLNSVPEGFNNNIAWNFGHIIVTQQLLCDVRAGLKNNIDQSLTDRFRKGSSPDQPVNEQELAFFKSELIAQIDQLQQKLGSGAFEGRQYEQLVTSYGVTIHTIGEAVHYLATHDALHYGYALALKRCLR
jgi:hypothetical protein